MPYWGNPKQMRAIPLGDGLNYELRFKYHPGLKDAVKAIPGVSPMIKDKKWKGWRCQEDVFPIAADYARRCGFEVNLPPVERRYKSGGELNSKLHSFQQEAVRFLLGSRRGMLNFEMGLGKTPSAIEACRLAEAKRVLVVCPAMVRLNWEDEFGKWWPDHPEIEVVESGKQAKAASAPIIITSYELTSKLATSQFDAIVVDESQYVQDRRAGRSKSVAKILAANLDAYVMFLTATPITNRPKGLHNQLDLLYPERFGSWSKFNTRYSQKLDNQYTEWDFGGLNDEHADELKSRLDLISIRVTKAEVAHLLPPCMVQSIRVRAPRSFNPRELLERFTRPDAHNGKIGALVRAAGEHKVEAAVDHAENAFENGESHVAVLTHLKATAEEVAAAMRQKGHEVIHVDGDVATPKRVEAIKQCKALKQAVLVTTMHAVNVGIDLTFCTTAIFAELYWTPAVMIQAFGRFSRLSGTMPSRILMLVLEGSQDEIIAHKLLEKTQDITSVIDAGHAEAGLDSALAEAEDIDEEEFLAGLKAAAMSMITEEDAYV
jgi:SWI/SNF-related matrix-associated actin-dependent regulator 1 of chromatin subfamily A